MQSITITEGTKIHTHGIGDIELKTEAGVIRLTDVWHAPRIAASLISVARMVDAGYTVEFGRTTCFGNKGRVKTKLGQ